MSFPRRTVSLAPTYSCLRALSVEKGRSIETKLSAILRSVGSGGSSCEGVGTVVGASPGVKAAPLPRNRIGLYAI